MEMLQGLYVGTLDTRPDFDSEPESDMDSERVRNLGLLEAVDCLDLESEPVLQAVADQLGFCSERTVAELVAQPSLVMRSVLVRLIALFFQGPMRYLIAI